jgi:hypothetical protein
VVAKGARSIGGTPGPEGRNPGHSPRPFGAAGDLANPKGDKEQWQSGSEYETLRHHLEAAYAATEAALVEEASEVVPGTVGDLYDRKLVAIPSGSVLRRKDAADHLGVTRQ